MDKHIDDIEFVIFDTETTGLEPGSGDRIAEIAGIKFKGSTRLGVFESLVNPKREISPGAFAVNKITADMLKSAPGIEEIMPQFLNFIQGSCLCSYNAGFDLGFLYNELKITNMALAQDILAVDILKMARRLLPGLERYALWFVAEKLGVMARQEHRALSDVELTLSVFNNLKEKFKAKGISDFSNFAGLFGINSHFLDNINNRKIAEIQRAMDLKVKLRIKYLSSSGAEVSEREVVPKEIRQERDNIYLIGYCCLRKDERSFRLDGILHIEII